MKIPTSHLDIKLIAFDLDDTLLTKDCIISPRTLETIRECAAKGIYIVLCSGRAENGILPFVRMLDIAGTEAGRYIIAFNGATVFDLHKRQQIYSNQVDTDILKFVYRKARERGMSSVVYDPDTIYSWIDNDFARLDAKLCHLNFKVIEDFETFLEKGYPKMLVPSEPSKVKDFCTFLQKELDGRADVFTSKPFFLEVMTHGVGKGYTIERLASILNIPMNKTMAFGDSMNDESMIRMTGHSVAMCNGLDYIKDIADYVTRYDNNNDGIADFLKEFVL